MKKVSANFRIEIRNIEVEIEDNASTIDCYNALNSKAKRSLYGGEYWVEYTKSSEKKLCPDKRGSSGFDLPLGWTEDERQKIEKEYPDPRILNPAFGATFDDMITDHSDPDLTE